MNLQNITSIITAIGVIGSLFLGFTNLISLRKSEMRTRKHLDYEKRKDLFLKICADYFAKADIRSITFTADNLDDYGTMNKKAQDALYEIETCYYHILLYISHENICSTELEAMFEKSFSILSKAYHEIAGSSFAFASSMTQSFEGRYFKIDGTIISGEEIENTRKEMLENGMNNFINCCEEFKAIKKDLLVAIKQYLKHEEALALGKKHKQKTKLIKD